MIESKNLDSFFAEAADWDHLRYKTALKNNKTLKIICTILFVLFIISMCSIFFMLPLKEIVPVVIRVNEMTGKYDVQGRGFEFNMSDKKNEATIFQDVIRYIKSRESFTRGQAETLYNTAYLMSCGAVREDVKNYYLADINPESPLNKMRPEDSSTIDVRYYAFIPSIDETKTVQVRYSLTHDIKGKHKKISQHIATITFRYSKNNIPDDLNDRSLNAFGFCAINYQTSQEGSTVMEKSIKKGKKR